MVTSSRSRVYQSDPRARSKRGPEQGTLDVTMRGMRQNLETVAVAFLVLGCGAATGVAQPAGGGLGAFEAHGDVGATPKAGSVEYDSASGEYRVTGGGANIWSTTDAFQFAWNRLSGDVTLTADVRFVGTGKVNHRKAVLMIRQGLDAGAAYVDAALHGDGLTSLQFRPTDGAETQEVKAEVNAPRRIRIERRGNVFTMFVGNPGEDLKAAGTATVVLQDPVSVGIGVCSHDAEIVETAVFSNVQLAAKTAPGDQLAVVTEAVVPAAAPRKGNARDRKKSRISIYDLASKSMRVVYESDKVFEAPNWSPDSKYLLSNSGGNLFRIPLDGAAEPQKIDLGSISRCNNDHGISPDGKWLALSASPGRGESQVFLASIDGARPRLMTQKAPSYFHGWSPDGRWLAFVGQRNGIYNLYRVAAAGGEEERLTSRAAYDDGPDYSPDGRWIYFNSNRSGNWDVWRMPADGAGATDERAQQVTWDELEDWFPHPSPDGKWLVFLSFPKGTEGHDAEMEVSLRIMPLPGAKIEPAAIQVLGTVLGGQGTINVNSWSPDSKKFAFVSYEIGNGKR
jgi:regulation of enolase protein 1 (concanavalin A-like superfamily)